MSIILLRLYATHIKRWKRIALVTLAFMSFHLIHSRFSSKPLLVATELILSASASISNKYAAAEDSAFIIFYNLFIPHEESGIPNAINVTKDQLQQISTALHRLEDPTKNSKRKWERRGVVYYNLIGSPTAVSPEQMSELCHSYHPRLECVRLNHYNNATESVTLTDLYNFCHTDPVPGHVNRTRVTYLHSKGSYHDHGKQTPWRRELTYSSLHPSCQYPPNDECDVCGAQHYIMFASMFPGNMWTAKCSYIRKLLPPTSDGEYIRRREESVKKAMLLQIKGIMTNRLGLHQDVFYGLDRYQNEHWVGGHPSLTSCEMHHTDIAFWDMTQKELEPHQYSWGMGPRRDYIFDKPGDGKKYSTKDDDLNFRQYYYLMGHMVKWLTLYEEVPPLDSWAFQRVPAHGRWRDLVKKHGTKALDVAIESNSQYYSPFAINHTKIDFEKESQSLLNRTSPTTVVFYHITFQLNTEGKAADVVKAQFQVLSMGRYDNTNLSFDQSQKILLYYTIAGGKPESRQLVSQLCKEKSAMITCYELGVHDSDHVSGETLTHLHSFCLDKPSSNVIYISNQLMPSDVGAGADRYNIDKIKLATAAVMSTMCQITDHSCNVCGTEFYPLPFLQFTGNMFSASCGYVSKLMPPRKYQKSLYTIAGGVTLAYLRKQFTTELFGKFNPRILGLDQYSIEHWIGSHPYLRPCDVAPMKAPSITGSFEDQMKQYSLALAPRRGSAAPDFPLTAKEADFRLKREFAFREYLYLAGNVFRWYKLYNKIPSTESWTWEWFPDGRTWETAARSEGAYAVNAIAQQLNTNVKEIWVE